MGLTENRASGLLTLNGPNVPPNSVVRADGAEVGLAASGQRIAVLAPSGSRVLSGFEGETSALVLGPKNAANLEALRGRSVRAPSRASETGRASPPDTHAFASIPSRHDVWRRITCDWLAGMVLTGIVDELLAASMAREFVTG
jgi:hypothetical protein